MVRKHSEMETEIRREMRGGKGEVHLCHAFRGDEMTSPCRLCATLTLDPGCSIGLHDHVGEDEVYYILQGSGTVYENGSPVPVAAGDAVLTGNGVSHSIENTGCEVLKLFAAVVRYAD